MAEAFRERATLRVRGASPATRYCRSRFRAKPTMPHSVSAARVPGTARAVPEEATSNEKPSRESRRSLTIRGPPPRSPPRRPPGAGRDLLPLLSARPPAGVHAHDLWREPPHEVHEVALQRDDGLDVLVGHRGLIQGAADEGDAAF